MKTFIIYNTIKIVKKQICETGATIIKENLQKTRISHRLGISGTERIFGVECFYVKIEKRRGDGKSQ